MSTLERAILIAAQAHLAQVDKSGAPYILHPLRVMLRTESNVEMIVAVLHDLVEDTEWTLSDLRREGFSESVLQAIDSLTRRPGESYPQFVDRVKINPVARVVKLADLEDNMDVKRLHSMGDSDFSRLKAYHQAWKSLSATRET